MAIETGIRDPSWNPILAGLAAFGWTCDEEVNKDAPSKRWLFENVKRKLKVTWTVEAEDYLRAWLAPPRTL
jgi:hypothetical protein